MEEEGEKTLTDLTYDLLAVTSEAESAQDKREIIQEYISQILKQPPGPVIQFPEGKWQKYPNVLEKHENIQ